MANVTHSTLTGADLHEPKGIAAQAADKYYVSDGAGSGAWTAIPVVPFPSKHIAGLTWSNAADASNDITIAAGTCRDVNNTEDMTLSASITKRIDASWAVGDNQGGFDTGSVSATGVYHLFLIKRTDTDVVDAIFTATIGGPTLPTNYTKSRRIGSFYRQAGVNSAVTVTETSGGGIEVMRNTPVDSGNLTAASTGTAGTLAQFPNNTSGLEAIFFVSSNNGLPNIAWSPTTTTYTPAVFANTALTSPDSGGDTITTVVGAYGRCRAVSGQVKFYTSNGGSVVVTTLGWNDPRRS